MDKGYYFWKTVSLNVLNASLSCLSQFFVEQIKKLIFTRKLRYVKTPAALANASTKDVMAKMMNELVQYSMSLANDSYQTSLCLQFSPEEIATACVYLACQFAGVEPVVVTANGSADWKTTLGDPDVDVMFSICLQILDLISDKKASDMENVKKIRAALELMRSREEQPSSTTTGGGTTNSKPPSAAKPDPGATPPPPTPADDGNPNKRPRFG